MFFSDQIFRNFLRQKALPSICFKTRGWVSETCDLWAFEALRENQKLDLEFEKFGQVFKKLVRVVKKLATRLCYNTSGGAAISHCKEN